MWEDRTIPFQNGGSVVDGGPSSSEITVVTTLSSSTLETGTGKLLPSAMGLRPVVLESRGLRAPLPKLPYSLRTRKTAITIAWAFILLDSCVLPLSLFFILKFGAKLNDARSVGISNSVFGFFGFFQFTFRMFRLLRKSPQYRPLGSTSRFSLDFYQIQFFIGFVVVTALISFGTSVSPPLLRVLAMSPTALLVQCGPQFIFSCYASRNNWKAPCRMSSVAKGEYAPPALFTIIEDIIAVDGGGGREYRAAIKARYETSEKFREMIWQLTLVWGIGATLAGAAASAVIWTVPEYVAYGFGWSFPFVWAAIMALWTIPWVQKKLKQERDWWDDETTRF